MTGEKTFTVQTRSPQTIVKSMIQVCGGEDENGLVTFDNDFVKGQFKYLDYPDKMMAIIMDFYCNTKVRYYFSSVDENEKWITLFYNSQSCILLSDKINTPQISHNNNDSLIQLQEDNFSWQPSFDTDTPVKLIVIFIHPNLLAEIGVEQNSATESNNFFDKAEPVKFMPIARHLLDMTEQIFGMLRPQDNKHLVQKKLESYLWALIYDTLYEFTHNQNNKEKQTTDNKPEDVRHQILAARDEMLRDFSKSSLDLDYLAKFAGMNRTKFQQAFKDIFNISFYKYYQEARFNEALRLLESESSTTTCVAAAIGYKNVGYFIKEFQKRFGMTPNEYRMKNAK